MYCISNCQKMEPYVWRYVYTHENNMIKSTSVFDSGVIALHAGMKGKLPIIVCNNVFLSFVNIIYEDSSL